MQQVKFENVFQSYNGKCGCMCGCRGKYTIPEHTSIEEANKEVGYNGYDEEDVSNRRVKLAVNKVNKALAMTEEEREEAGIELLLSEEDSKFRKYVAVNQGDRSTTVYLK